LRAVTRRIAFGLILLACAAAPATYADPGDEPPDGEALKPTMTVREARERVPEALRDWYGRDYRAGRAKRLSCRSVALPRVRCAVSWRRRTVTYRGTASAFRWWDGEGWGVDFTIKRTETACRKSRRPCRMTDQVSG
jgi:hypothetical protein